MSDKILDESGRPIGPLADIPTAPQEEEAPKPDGSINIMGGKCVVNYTRGNGHTTVTGIPMGFVLSGAFLAVEKEDKTHSLIATDKIISVTSV